MKKLILIISALVLIAALSACDVRTSAPKATEPTAKFIEEQSYKNIGAELTRVSSATVYSGVQNMMLKPED